MKKVLMTAVAALFGSVPAHAALSVGSKAPDFTLQASLGGKVFSFSLAEALKSGPVVLYFYPAAFTKGCTLEAHNFAEAADQFKALGATIIGVSHDDIDTLNRFSVTECRSKFAVAADVDRTVMKKYGAVLLWKYASRTSYVIAPDGTILLAYTALNPDDHVRLTMDAVKKWKAMNPR